MNYFKTKTYLLYHLHLQPSEIENLPFYEYQYIVDNLIEIMKEKQKSEEEQGEEAKQYQKYKNPEKMMKSAQSKMPKISGIPGAGNFKFPSMSNIKI